MWAVNWAAVCGVHVHFLFLGVASHAHLEIPRRKGIK